MRVRKLERSRAGGGRAKVLAALTGCRINPVARLAPTVRHRLGFNSLTAMPEAVDAARVAPG